MVRTRCPPISEFRLGFSFPSGLFVGRASFGRCHSLLLPLSVTVVPFFCACVVSLSCKYGCHALVLGFFINVFLPFRLDMSGFGVRVSSQSLELSFWLFLDPFLLCS